MGLTLGTPGDIYQQRPCPSVRGSVQGAIPLLTVAVLPSCLPSLRAPLPADRGPLPPPSDEVLGPRDWGEGTCPWHILARPKPWLDLKSVLEQRKTDTRCLLNTQSLPPTTQKYPTTLSLPLSRTPLKCTTMRGGCFWEQVGAWPVRATQTGF